MFDKLKKYVVVRQTTSKEYNVSFVDFNFNEIVKTKSSEYIPNSLVMDVFSNKSELKRTDIDNAKNLILENIYNLSENQDERILEKLSIKDPNENVLKIKIRNASNYVAVNGRIGVATNIIISKENYDKFNLSELESDFEFIFEDVKDIYLYRINNIDQPGLIFIYYTDGDKTFYEIEEIGFYPQKQYIKIKLY